MGNIHGLLPIQIFPFKISRFSNRKSKFLALFSLKFPKLWIFWSYIKLKQRMKDGLTFEKIEVEVEVDSVSPFGNKKLDFDRSQLRYFIFKVQNFETNFEISFYIS